MNAELLRWKEIVFASIQEKASYLEGWTRDNPADVEALGELGQTWRTLGKHNQAATFFARAVNLAPDHSPLVQSLIDCVWRSLYAKRDPELKQALIHCLGHSGAARRLALPATSLVVLEPMIADLLNRLATGQSEGVMRDFVEGRLDDALADDLLTLLLTGAAATNSRLEILLRTLRQAALTEIIEPRFQTGSVSERRFSFLGALALQCQINEQVYLCSADEQLLMEELLRTMASQLDAESNAERGERRPSDLLQSRLVICAMYRPLREVEELLPRAPTDLELWRPPVRPLIREMALAKSDREIRRQIASVSLIQDAVSLAVQNQYEESPYPRWLSPTMPNHGPLGAFLSDRFHHFEPSETLDGPVTALDAGCGTGKNTIQLVGSFDARIVVGVDLSIASLAYARRKADELGVSNVEFLHGDLLDIPNLGRTFDLIECIGVLHHMQNPLEGWRALKRVLRPGGVMKVALYSHRARESVRRFWEWRKAEGFGTDVDEIRRCRDAMMKLPEEHPMRSMVVQPRFYCLSECRDLLFHVQERQFRLPEIADALESLGLKLIGFDLPRPWSQAYARAYPEDVSQTDFACWDEFERMNPGVFAGMITFWCQDSQRD